MVLGVSTIEAGSPERCWRTVKNSLIGWLGLVSLVAVGCGSSTVGKETEIDRKAPQPPTEVDLIVRSETGEILNRSRPTATLSVSSPVTLSLQTSTLPDKVEFYAVYGDAVRSGVFGPGPGVIGSARGGQTWQWPITPGQQAHIYGVAWYGKVGVRSEELLVQYPMPKETHCPDISFPPLRPTPHAQVELIVSADMNLIEIVTPYENLYFSMEVDPGTCKDELVRHWLEQAGSTMRTQP